MFEVPHNASTGSPWRLALLWMGVAVMSAAVVYYDLIFKLIRALFSRALDVEIETLILITNLVQALWVVIFQSLVLRRFFPNLRYWASLHAIIGMIQLLLFSTPFGKMIRHTLEAISADVTITLIYDVLSLLGILFLGCAGWIVFRPIVRRASLWLWVFLLGKIIEWFLLGIPVSPAVPSSSVLYLLIFCGSILLPAAMQAAVLMQFLRDRQRPAVAAAWGGQDV